MSTILQFLFKATLFIAFSWVTGTGQTRGVPTSFIFCHAEAPFCASKSCVAARAVLLAARHLACACHQLKKAHRCLSFCDCLWYKKLPVLCLSMTLWWSKILHSLKSMTPPKCFVFDYFRWWSRQSVIGRCISCFCLFWQNMR